MKRGRLCRGQRLTNGSEIRNTRRNGTRVSFGGLTVYSLKHKNGPSRFVVIVPSSVDKRAVVRNKIKRQISAALSLLASDFVEGFDVVISVNSQVPGTEDDKVLDKTRHLLDNLKLLK